MAKKKYVEEPVYPVAPLVISKDKFIELLTVQIEKGKELLEIDVPKKTQHTTNYGGFVSMSRTADHVEYNEAVKKDFIAQYSRWNDRNKAIYRNSFDIPESIYYHEYESNIWNHLVSNDLIKIYKEEIERLINHMQSDIERVDLIKCIAEADSAVGKFSKTTVDKKKVFVVHGHAESVNQEVARAIEKLGLEAIVLREQPNSGKTIIEKFEGYAKDVNFAVILLTADDKIEGAASFRARQNVVFEMGYFMGALGRDHVMCMLQENVETPGDIDGVVYTPIDKNGVWKYSLIKELKTCGYDVDANKVL